jgi:hypothetical protein
VPAEHHDVLEPLREFVRRRALDLGRAGWRELITTFADERSFVECSVRRLAGRERILIEFGVVDQRDRHRVGFFDAYWDPSAAQFKEIQGICLHGQSVALESLLEEVRPFLSLPLHSFDEADVDESR